MEALLQQLSDWLKGMLVDGIMNNLSGMFDAVNQQVADVATQVGNSPANFSPAVFGLVRNISETVIIPIAGMFLTFIACYELIQLIIEHASAGLISGSTAVDASTLDSIRDTLEAMEVGPLLGLFLQSFIVQVCSSILSVAIFVIVYGRMMEIYLMTSLAPIPFSTFGNREQSHIGQNYLRALFALGFQGFLIMICIGIYAVLVQTVAFTDNIIGSIWGVMGYTVMAAYIPVPRDLTRVKTKVFFNLTKRQLICFGAGALMGVPSFFLLKRIGSTSLAAMGMILIMLPMFLLAMYERDGQPLEVFAKHFIETKFIRPKIRPYQTNNYYDALMRAAAAEKEVDKIVSVYEKKKSPAGRKTAGKPVKKGSEKGGGNRRSRKEK